jgi:ribosome-associated toxin RatA of RatAB toxin-antitoxin module
MPKVSSSTELPVPAKTVWDVIGNFNALPDWHPAVAKSQLEKQDGGTLRKLSLVGGGTIEEKLEQIDDKERRYTYSIVSGPLPVANYTATLKVRESQDGDGCTVEWSSEFEAKGAPEGDAVAAISGIYEAGFDNLKKIFGG